MGKMEMKGIRILNDARTLGRVKTRDELKQQGKSFGAITSPRSLEIHKSNWKDFSTWLEKENIKSLKKIDDDFSAIRIITSWATNDDVVEGFVKEISVL